MKKPLYTYQTVEEPKLTMYVVTGPDHFIVRTWSGEHGIRLAKHMNEATQYKMDAWAKTAMVFTLLNLVAAITYFAVVIF